jgi:uncharacterized membrane protein/protein-disulfide isomerase
MTELNGDQDDAALDCPAPALWAMRLVALGGLCMGSVLLLVALRGGSAGLPGCSSDGISNCDVVLTSQWSRWLGLPTAALAVALYVTALAALAYVGPKHLEHVRRAAWGVLICLAVMASAAALWFIYVQLFRLGSICIYCMVAHACAVTFLLLVFGYAPWRGGVRMPFFHRRAALPCVVLGLLGGGALIAGQVLYPPPPLVVAGQDTNTGPGAERVISLLGGRVFGLKPHDYPILGSPDADHVMVFLFHYTCPFCRGFHGYIEQALDRYQGRVAVILLPIPMDSQCNPSVETTKPEHVGACDRAKLMLAVWRANPAAFAAFDRWMFESKKAQPVEATRRRAIELVGEQALDAALADPWVGEQIDANIKLYGISSLHVERRSVPQLILGKLIIGGRPPSAEAFFKLLEEDAGVVPPEGDASPQ